MAAQAVQLAGGATTGLGALFTGQAQSGALDRAALIERQNAALDLQAGDENAAISTMRSNKALGQITASYGANGIASDSGSALAVLAASTANAELDRQNILHGAKVRAINYENQAAMDEVGAKSALQGSYMSALGAMVGGGAKAFGDSAGASPGSYKAIKTGGKDASDPSGVGGENEYVPTEGYD